MFPELANQSLPSGGKFVEAGYVSVCDGDKFNIYDGRTATITVSEDAFMKGWQCPRTKLWRIPLRSQVTDSNMHILLLNGPTGCEYINYLYTVLTSAAVLDHIERFNTNHATGATIHNVYKLLSLLRAVQYIHSAARFPTKSKWLKSICSRN